MGHGRQARAGGSAGARKRVLTLAQRPPPRPNGAVAEGELVWMAGERVSVQPGVLLARGVCRALLQHGWSVLTEVTLANGRRADVVALAGDGEIAIIEVKSSHEDFRADRKWGEY